MPRLLTHIAILLCFLSACAEQPGFLADGSADDIDASAGNDMAPAPTRRPRVFVTSKPFSGDLARAGGASTGRAGADALCQSLADAAALRGKYHAWLSDSRTDAIDAIVGDGPWLAPTGEMVFRDRANLMTTPLTSFTDEYGVSAITSVWTATGNSGRHVVCPSSTPNCDCDDWGATTGFGAFGVGYTTLWTDSTGFLTCDMPNSLLCFGE